MALIAPFRGLRYNSDTVSNLEDVFTPPYDVIDAAGEAAFRAKHPYNMIRLDLGKKTSGAEEDAGRYGASRDLLAQWEREQVLIRDSKPTIYLYHVEYSHPSGQRLVRKGLVALVGLAEFSEGIVKPHEKTFRGVVTDRLRLLETCQTQFSQIFSLYPDPEGAVMRCLESACAGPPLYRAVDGDNGYHSLWAVDDPAALAEVRRRFTDKTLYIADGHHRYTTALQLREKAKVAHGALPVDSPFNFTMMYLCPMEDPGLSVLPTHRLARLPGGAPLDDIFARLAPAFTIAEIKGGSREALVSETMGRMADNAQGRVVFGLYRPKEDSAFLLTLKEGAMEATFGDRQPPVLRQLDVVVLSDLLLEHCLGLTHDRCADENLVDYFSDLDEALDQAVKEAVSSAGREPLLFLMNPTAVSQVQQVADAGLVMPHKSTYFYPKILTGLVMHKIVAAEAIA